MYALSDIGVRCSWLIMSRMRPSKSDISDLGFTPYVASIWRLSHGGIVGFAYAGHFLPAAFIVPPSSYPLSAEEVSEGYTPFSVDSY